MTAKSKRYPKFIGVNLEQETYDLLTILGNRDERRDAQQVRWFVKVGIRLEIGRVVVWLMGGQNWRHPD
jgi:hypothetical protein